ncbi:MAG: Na/Pi symporter [Acidimicrobiia bacterium]|nr:MAG: Na/Pi symporter [Acidimicrobiia bacterium]
MTRYLSAPRSPGEPHVTDQQQDARRLPSWARAVLVVALLYLFLVGVKMLEGGIKGLGAEYTDAVFAAVSSPIAGLLAGILATVLVQSSSVSTSTIVGLVASGVVSVETAIPMIMGANIGTTVTNTLVALTHVRRSAEFSRSFAAATMHDFFNFFAVAVFLPLELATGFLSRSATALAELLGGSASGGTFDSPIKAAVKWGAGLVEEVPALITDHPVAFPILVAITGIGLIFVALSSITRNMRLLVVERIERSLNEALARSGVVGMVVGALVTISVQSSSITTSILIPLCAAGVLALRNAYPITLGANVGTTITALIAAVGAGSVDALTIAITHTLFNLAGILLIYPIPRFRYLPVRAAEALTSVAQERKWLAFAYVVGAFFGLPVLGIILF